jgi:hypothetical protein
MWAVVRSLYARRIVNVNVNVITAGILALIPVLGIVKAAYLLDVPHGWIPLITFVADVVCDVTIYYVLHWLANHAPVMRRDRLETLAYAATVDHVPFFKDATIVQVQRMVLSPVLYGLWLGTQWLMLLEGFNVVWATVAGFFVGVGTARTLHTFWMIWEARAKPPAPRRPDPASTPGPRAQALPEREKAGV